MRRDPQSRFWRKVSKTETCWLWTGYLNQGGYAPFMFNSAPNYAHRFSFIVHSGTIPDGCEIDHICRVRNCVNPEHLRAVDHRTNILSGQTIPARNAAKTHCKRGHEFTPDNTYLNTRGERQCRACCRLRSVRARALQEAA